MTFIFNFDNFLKFVLLGGNSSAKTQQLYSDFLTPLGPLGASPYRFEQKWCSNRLCVAVPNDFLASKILENRLLFMEKCVKKSTLHIWMAELKCKPSTDSSFVVISCCCCPFPIVLLRIEFMRGKFQASPVFSKKDT